jgi:DNA modification methylase
MTENNYKVPLENFEKAHYNPRIITPENFQRLKDSIKNHTKNMIDWEESDGLRLVEPIIINKLNNRLIAGHQRTSALLDLNQDWIHSDDVRFIFVEDELEERGLSVKLNSEDLKGDFDEELLRDIIYEFQEIDYDLDEISDSTGLDVDYISEVLDAGIEPDDKDNEVPEIPEEPQTESGDVYLLNGHRVMCGDSTDGEQVGNLMDGKKADMVFTDPPYNVNYESRSFKTKVKNDNINDFINFLKKIYDNIDLYTKTESYIYICHALLVMEFDVVLENYKNWSINNKIIWVKDIPTYSMAKYKWQYEPILFVTKGSPEWFGDKTQTNVWKVRSIQSAGSEDDNGNKWFEGGSEGLTLHPTQKPVELITKALLNSCKKECLVTDFFLGSGSTLIACEKTNRICYGLELDEYCCDVIVQRYIDYTGTTDNCFRIRNNKKTPLKDIWSK